MEIKLTRLNDFLAFRSTNEEGQSIRIDASSAVGGKGLGMRPMEILASSLASCASIDILLILKKKRIVLKQYEIRILAERQFSVPAAFQSIHLVINIGKDDPMETVEKAARLSLEKYCSVAATVHPDCQLTFEVRN